MATQFDINFPEAFKPVVSTRKRYKVLWGGRGAGRSWNIARSYLLMGAGLLPGIASPPLRFLCARELQNSIADSVHRLLADQITNLGLNSYYEVQRDRILGFNGTGFSFEGIKNNVNKIKSYEGIDYCWVEEGNKVSKNSWGILIPTIRKEGSEIWISFNPELEEDYTYQEFVKHANPDMMMVIKMTWRDNPWFPQTLKEELEKDKARDYDRYLNIWEGHCIQMLEGAVYAKELRKAAEQGRICKVPWDHETPVDVFWDLGRADQTAMWFVQRVAMQYRILAYYSNSFEDIPHYLNECRRRGYVYGTMWLPHDAKAKRLGTKRTIQEQISQFGYTTRIVPNVSRVDGINAARTVFPNCWFDEVECEEGINALRHYRYKVIDNQVSNEPLHDWASDGSDAFRYFAVACQSPREKSKVGERLAAAAQAVLAKRAERVSESSRMLGSGRHGWMR